MEIPRGQSETIVEYSAVEAARNDYPRRIVSPLSSSACCATEMNTLGAIHCENERPYIYRRCAACGYTVRHFFVARGVDCLGFLEQRVGLERSSAS